DITTQGIHQPLIYMPRLASSPLNRYPRARCDVGDFVPFLELLEYRLDRSADSRSQSLTRADGRAAAPGFVVLEHAGRESCLAGQFHDGHVVLLAQAAHLYADGFLQVVFAGARRAGAGGEFFLRFGLFLLHHLLQCGTRGSCGSYCPRPTLKLQVMTGASNRLSRAREPRSRLS